MVVTSVAAAVSLVLFEAPVGGHDADSRGQSFLLSSGRKPDKLFFQVGDSFLHRFERRGMVALRGPRSLERTFHRKSMLRNVASANPPEGELDAIARSGFLERPR